MKIKYRKPNTIAAIAALALITPQIADAALMAQWKMDETTGVTASDSSANSYDISGAVGSFDLGVAGNAAFNPRLQISSSVVNSTLNNVGGSITVSAWIKMDAASGSNSFAGIAGYEGIGSGGIESYGLKYTQNDEVQWGVNEDYVTVGSFFTTYVDTNTDTVADTFAHVVGVFDHVNGESFLYVNGSQVATKSTTRTIIASGQNFAIGNYATGGTTYDFIGGIDDVQVYGEALSASDVSALFANPGLNLTTIPEPSSTALLGLGGLALILRRRV